MRLYCQLPAYADAWIERSDEWRGVHIERYEQALDKARTAGLNGVYLGLVLSLALLDDWNIPGYGGNHDNWNWREMPQAVIDWINLEGYVSFNEARKVPKGLPSPLLNGSAGVTAEHGS